MSKYSGKTTTLAIPRTQLFDKISNLSSFQERLDALPEDAKAKLGDVKFTDDKILINAPAVGQLVFTVTRREAPSLLCLSAENSPVPFLITIHLAEETPDTTRVDTELDVDIPMALRPLVGSKLQMAADQFSGMFSSLFGN